MEIANKVAIVTGGTRGIGLAIARALLDQGMRVAVCARDGAPAQEFRSTDVGAFVCDVRRFDQVENFIASVLDKWGQIDLLVNNAGVGYLGEFGELSVEQWVETVETNLSGPVYTCMASLAALKRSRGHIVNICSRSSRNPNPRGTFYNASKFGLLGFSDALAIDMMRWGIKVTSILPGPVATHFAGIPAEEWQLSPEDVANAVVHAITASTNIHNLTIELRPARPAT